MYRNSAFRPRRAAGFTLIELMVTVAIVAILASIALPSYTNQVRKSRRGDAKIGLLDMAARQERFNTTNFRYTTSLAELGYGGTGTNTTVLVPSSTTAYYELSITLQNGTSSFTLKATPRNDQRNDGCQSFTLTDLGVQALADNPTNSVADCWK